MTAPRTGSSDLALVHLVRHANGLAPFEAFLASLDRAEPGREHDLVLLFKGFEDPADAAPYLERAGTRAPLALHVEDVGLDLTAYLSAAARLPHRFVAFVNSFSEALVPGWLGLLAGPVQDGRAGAAGATGSWGAHLAYRMFQLGIPGGYADVFASPREARVALDALAGAPVRPAAVRWAGNLVLGLRDVPSMGLFPAVHLRTNAFVTDRALLLSLRTGRLRSKHATYRLESGRSSLTAQLRARGRPAVVVDRHGAVRAAPQWHEADVFWQARQEDLLVADNQTRQYMTATAEQRQALSRFAWGPQARPAHPEPS